MGMIQVWGVFKEQAGKEIVTMKDPRISTRSLKGPKRRLINSTPGAVPPGALASFWQLKASTTFDRVARQSRSLFRTNLSIWMDGSQLPHPSNAQTICLILLLAQELNQNRTIHIGLWHISHQKRALSHFFNACFKLCEKVDVLNTGVSYLTLH